MFWERVWSQEAIKWLLLIKSKSRFAAFSAVVASLSFWKLFDYEITQGSLEKDWITLSNKTHLEISLVQIGNCPHLFPNPGLNYFNGGNNLPIIEKINAAGIPITEEITYFNKEGIVDNIIIQDPGGLGFFISLPFGK